MTQLHQTAIYILFGLSPRKMTKTTASRMLLRFPVLKRADVIIFSILLIFASCSVASSSATTTDEDCGKYCGKTCGDLPSAEQDACKVSLENCNCTSTPPKAKGPSGRWSSTKITNSQSSYQSQSSNSGTRYSSYSSGGGDQTMIWAIVGGVFGFIILIVCIVGCVFLCIRSSAKKQGLTFGGNQTQSYQPQAQAYQPYESTPSQHYGNSNVYGSDYGAVNY